MYRVETHLNAKIPKASPKYLYPDTRESESELNILVSHKLQQLLKSMEIKFPLVVKLKRGSYQDKKKSASVC